MDELTKTIIAHEGSNKFSYKDSRGFNTIGVGRCIDSRCSNGLSVDEISYLLANDLVRCKAELAGKSFYLNQDDVRKEVLVELVFNIGLEGLETFTTFLSMMSNHGYKDAANDLKSTKWSSEVHADRVNNICYRIVNGHYP